MMNYYELFSLEGLHDDVMKNFVYPYLFVPIPFDGKVFKKACSILKLSSEFHALSDGSIRFKSDIICQRQSVQTRRILTLQKQALRVMTFSDFRAHFIPLFLDHTLLSFFDLNEIPEYSLYSQNL